LSFEYFPTYTASTSDYDSIDEVAPTDFVEVKNKNLQFSYTVNPKDTNLFKYFSSDEAT
jgi:hypothetical protein